VILNRFIFWQHVCNYCFSCCKRKGCKQYELSSTGLLTDGLESKNEIFVFLPFFSPTDYVTPNKACKNTKMTKNETK
jgi:hypothetical protein